MNPKYKKVAEAVRLEQNLDTGDYFITFLIVDEQFKKTIRENWQDDIELKVIGKNLVKKGK